MRGRAVRRLCVLAGALALGLASAPGASATITANVDGDVIRVEGGAEANTIEVFYALFSGELRFTDPAGAVSSATCTAAGNDIDCPTTVSTARIVFDTGGGEDTVEFLSAYTNFIGPFLATDFNGGASDDAFTAFGRGTLNGGAGRDDLTGGADGDAGNRILGGPGNDLLTDTEGNDTLNGGGGADRLIGGDDRDRYKGGAGRDRIRARDFTKDLGINCGPGRDRVRRDPFDPRPRSC